MGDGILECSYTGLHELTKNLTMLCHDPNYSGYCASTYFNLIYFNYCIIGGQTWLTYVIIILIVVLSFYLLSSTGNDYLAPALGILSEKLDLSQNLAGLTLLALGNQAPDITVALVTSESADNGIESSLASLLGGGMMVIGLVMSTCVYFGKQVNVVPANYVRDLLVYLFSLVLIFVYERITRGINIIEACSFLIFYILYVILCFFMDRTSKEEIEKEVTTEFGENEDFKVRLYKEENSINEMLSDNSKNDVRESLMTSNKPSSFDFNNYIEKSYFQKKVTALKGNEEEVKEDIIKEAKTFSKFRYDVFRFYFAKEKTWAEQNVFEKFLTVCIDFPFNFLRDLTIPAYEKEKWKRIIFILHPFTIPIFFILACLGPSFFHKHYLGVSIFFSLMLILSFIFYRITYRTNMPNFLYAQLIFAIIFSIVWMWTITNFLVDSMEVAQLLFPVQVPKAFLTMTVLAVGNSLPDYIINTSLAKTGFAEMAIAGCIGAPLFGILFGFGVSLVKSIIKSGKIREKLPFDLLKEESRTLLIAMISAAVLVIVYVIGGAIQKFKIKRCQSLIGYIVYTIYALCLIFFTFIFDLIVPKK